MENESLKKFLFTLFIIMFFIVSFGDSVLAGFGVSPPQIKENNLVRGSHFEKTIYLVQGNPQEDLDIEISVDSPNITKWFTFKDGTNFTIPAGVQQFPFNVAIDVPSNIDFGIYKAFVRVNTKPKKVEGSGQVSVALGGVVNVELIIGDNVVYQYIIKSIKILNIEEGDNPKISVEVKNTGNVPASPSSASFELYNKYGNVRLAYAENDDFKEVKAFSEDSSELEFSIDLKLAPGEYWAHVKIYNENGAVEKEMKTVFNVTKKSFFKKYIIPASITLVVISTPVLLRRRIYHLLIKKTKN